MKSRHQINTTNMAAARTGVLVVLLLKTVTGYPYTGNVTAGPDVTTSVTSEGDTTTSPTTEPIGTITTAGNCGIAPLNSRIVGGEDVSPGSWPWQVSLHVKGHVCGGSLINNQWVLTAAHCTQGSDASSWMVYLGRQTQNVSDNPHEVKRSVIEVVNHPDYGTPIHANDIALLKLSAPVTFSDLIRPVCLASSHSTFHNGTPCWATGWGAPGLWEELPPPQVLQEVALQVVGNKECSCKAKKTVLGDVVLPSMICAGGKEGKAVCHGDSGGPLQCKRGSIWVQAGITNFGVPCGTGKAPDVYARVSSFQSWIEKTVGEGPGLGFVDFISPGMDTDNDAACNTTQEASQDICGTVVPMVLDGGRVAKQEEGGRIVGGEEAFPGSWPWQVSLESIFGGHFCGGSLINKEWVLSAAHCFRGDDASEVTVHLGRHYLWDYNPHEEVRRVAKIILHPLYDGNTNDNDVALLRLDSPVTFNSFIRPVCLAAEGSVFQPGVGTWVTGWGATQEGEPISPPGGLQEVRVPVVGNPECQALMPFSSITSNMLCAGLLEGGKDSCQGDSGGPLVYPDSLQWVQSGVVSFGIGCARPELPGVYTRVSSYESWLRRYINTDPPGFVKVITPTMWPLTTPTDSSPQMTQSLLLPLLFSSLLFLLST